VTWMVGWTKQRVLNNPISKINIFSDM
jgi:hypothetical protein